MAFICIAESPGREDPMAVIYIGGEFEFAEVSQENGLLVVSVLSREDGQPWRIPYAELVEALAEAKRTLLGHA